MLQLERCHTVLAYLPIHRLYTVVLGTSLRPTTTQHLEDLFTAHFNCFHCELEFFIQGDSVARGPKLLSINNYVIEIMT